MPENKETAETQTHDAAMTPPTEAQPARRSKWRRHAAGIAATFIIVSAIFIMLPVTSENRPKEALYAAWQAVQNHDVQAFKNNVNLDSLVQSLMEQAIVYEETRQGREDASPEDIRKLLRAGVIGAFRRDLANTYTKQILTLVKQGNLPGDTQGLMTTLWAETGAQKQKVTSLQITDQHDSHAIATLTFERPDLAGKKLHLDLVLERDPLADHQGWAITGVPNLASFLLDVTDARKKLLSEINAPLREELKSSITLMDVQKSAGLGEGNQGVMWRIAYMNSSGKDIDSFTITMKIFNAKGELLATQKLQETDPLPAGATAEKAWPLPLTSQNSKQKQIIEGDLRTLQLKKDVTRIVFADGQKLELLSHLPNEHQTQPAKENKESASTDANLENK